MSPGVRPGRRLRSRSRGFHRTGDASRRARSSRADAVPAALPRRQIETNGYLASFPHLAGSVFSFAGSDEEALEQEALASKHEDWSAYQSMTDLVVLPAACYPVYPEIAKRGRLPAGGATVDTGSSWVFRNEPAGDPARMQIFHMLEFVRIGEPDAVGAFRDDWLTRTVDLLRRVGLDPTSEIATDPFFGRAGRMLAANQRVQELKFELVAMVGGPEATAIASFNYHQDHFGLIYGIETADGQVAHTGCVAFGLERITLAMFRANGLDLAGWPSEVRRELWP
jgi:seryl-tRNA synthetase